MVLLTYHHSKEHLWQVLIGSCTEVRATVMVTADVKMDAAIIVVADAEEFLAVPPVFAKEDATMENRKIRHGIMLVLRYTVSSMYLCCCFSHYYYLFNLLLPLCFVVVVATVGRNDLTGFIKGHVFEGGKGSSMNG